MQGRRDEPEPEHRPDAELRHRVRRARSRPGRRRTGARGSARSRARTTVETTSDETELARHRIALEHALEPRDGDEDRGPPRTRAGSRDRAARTGSRPAARLRPGAARTTGPADARTATPAKRDRRRPLPGPPTAASRRRACRRRSRRAPRPHRASAASPSSQAAASTPIAMNDDVLSRDGQQVVEPGRPERVAQLRRQPLVGAEHDAGEHGPPLSSDAGRERPLDMTTEPIGDASEPASPPDLSPDLAVEEHGDSLPAKPAPLVEAGVGRGRKLEAADELQDRRPGEARDRAAARAAPARGRAAGRSGGPRPGCGSQYMPWRGGAVTTATARAVSPTCGSRALRSRSPTSPRPTTSRRQQRRREQRDAQGRLGQDGADAAATTAPHGEGHSRPSRVRGGQPGAERAEKHVRIPAAQASFTGRRAPASARVASGRYPRQRRARPRIGTGPFCSRKSMIRWAVTGPTPGSPPAAPASPCSDGSGRWGCPAQLGLAEAAAAEPARPSAARRSDVPSTSGAARLTAARFAFRVAPPATRHGVRDTAALVEPVQAGSSRRRRRRRRRPPPPARLGRSDAVAEDVAAGSDRRDCERVAGADQTQEQASAERKNEQQDDCADERLTACEGV